MRKKNTFMYENFCEFQYYLRIIWVILCSYSRCNISLPSYIQNEILKTKSDEKSSVPDTDSPTLDPRYIGLCLPSKLEYIFNVSFHYCFVFVNLPIMFMLCKWVTSFVHWI